MSEFRRNLLIAKASESSVPSFADADWATIRSITRSGEANNYWQIGDTKSVTLTNNETYTLRICDMKTGRYDFVDNSGDKSNMVIEFVEQFTDPSYMNPTATDEGGWANCYMRDTTMAACLALLPSDLQDAISEVTVLSGTGGGSTSGTSSSANKLFLPCEYEIFGTKTHSIGSSEAGSSGQFEYYTAHNTLADRTKYREGTAKKWWLRSPARANGCFCVVGSDGYGNYNSANNQNGVAPCFAI